VCVCVSVSVCVCVCLCLCVCLSVCWSDRKVYCGKMADWISMLFWMASEVGQEMGVLDRGMGSFGVEFGVSHCN